MYIVVYYVLMKQRKLKTIQSILEQFLSLITTCIESYTSSMNKNKQRPVSEEINQKIGPLFVNITDFYGLSSGVKGG